MRFNLFLLLLSECALSALDIQSTTFVKHCTIDQIKGVTNAYMGYIFVLTCKNPKMSGGQVRTPYCGTYIFLNTTYCYDAFSLLARGCTSVCSRFRVRFHQSNQNFPSRTFGVDVETRRGKSRRSDATSQDRVFQGSSE